MLTGGVAHIAATVEKDLRDPATQKKGGQPVSLDSSVDLMLLKA
jgi:hypothetical protein